MFPLLFCTHLDARRRNNQFCELGKSRMTEIENYTDKGRRDQTTENGANKTAGVPTSPLNMAVSSTDSGTKVSSPRLFSFSV